MGRGGTRPYHDLFRFDTFGSKSRRYWIDREGAEPVLIPDIERFGEKDKVTGQQNWEEVPANSAMEGLLLPHPPGKEYHLLKVVTKPATADHSQDWAMIACRWSNQSKFSAPRSHQSWLS